MNAYHAIGAAAGPQQRKMDSDCSVQVLSEIATVPSISAEWSELMRFAVDNAPFMTPQWITTWWKSFGSGSLHIVAARRHDRLIGVAPLMIEARHILRRKRRVLQFCANAHSNRAFPVLHRDHGEQAAGIIAQWIARSDEWDLLRLQLLQRDAESTLLLTEALRAEGIRVGMRETHASPYLPLNRDLEPMDRLGGSFRQALKRKLRRAEKTTGLSVDVSLENTGGLEAAFEVSTETWQHAGETGIGSTPTLERFYRGLAESAPEWLYVPVAVLEEQPIAFEYNLLYDDRIFNLKLGFREGASALSPGLVLKYRVLQHAIRSGFTEYDFLGQAEPYKLHWTDAQRELGELWSVRKGALPRIQHRILFTLRPLLEEHAPFLLDVKRRFLRRGGSKGGAGD